MNKSFSPPQSVKDVLDRLSRPERVVVTGGMPYANGPIHLGHLAGAMVPPDIMARYMRMLIGNENVLFVSGNDDHGSTSEVAAIKAGKEIRAFIDEIHDKQTATIKRYGISYNIFTGTSRHECFSLHEEICQDFFRQLYHNGLLEKKITQQWFDTSLNRFLQDRNVTGECPNQNCSNSRAYSDNCEVCGAEFSPSELQNPKSSLSDTTPVLRDTVHWWLNMWKVSDELVEWVKTKQNIWRKPVYNQVIDLIKPALQFENTFESTFKDLKERLPQHKSRYAPGKKVVVQFECKDDFHLGKKLLDESGIITTSMDSWAHRSITRDVCWGIPLPADLDPQMKGKTLYVWPESLIAPLSFTRLALKEQGREPEEYERFWKNPKGRIYQFLGQDNVYFYTVMQGAMWLGVKKEIHRQPQEGELQMSDVFSVFHLMVNGEKMSKSTGNFYTGDQLIDEMGFAPDQIRYFLATLGLGEKPSNFDFETFNERNKFLAGPMNAAIEKPISAVHSRFNGRVPEGKILPKIEKETIKIVQLYTKNMPKAEYLTLLGQLENYARLINSLFVQFKPHDDRAEIEGRKDALYTCFYVLKNLMIMLYPFAPATMEKVRKSLNLSSSVWRLEELGVPVPSGHVIGEKQEYFPQAKIS